MIPRVDGPLNGGLQLVLDAFAPLGATSEGMIQPIRVVALDVGPGANLKAVKTLCIDGENDGRSYYEEGNVTPEWRTI